MFCETCGAENPRAQRFCGRCGAPLPLAGETEAERSADEPQGAMALRAAQGFGVDHDRREEGARLAIHTLGRFAVYRRGQLVEAQAWGRRKVREVFLYLVTHHVLAPHQPVVADELIQAFWRGLTPEAARGSLYVALSRLRRVLEPDLRLGHMSDFIHHGVGSYTLCLGAADRLDAAQFLRAAQAALAHGREAELTGAAQLYSGPYLPEESYAVWTGQVRERLTELYLAILAALADGHTERGEWMAAITCAQRMLLAAPSHEATHRRLMIYYARTGQRERALHQYHLCHAALVHSAGIEPSRETTALYYQLLHATP